MNPASLTTIAAVAAAAAAWAPKAWAVLQSKVFRRFVRAVVEDPAEERADRAEVRENLTLIIEQLRAHNTELDARMTANDKRVAALETKVEQLTVALAAERDTSARLRRQLTVAESRIAELEHELAASQARERTLIGQLRELGIDVDNVGM